MKRTLQSGDSWLPIPLISFLPSLTNPIDHSWGLELRLVGKWRALFAGSAPTSPQQPVSANASPIHCSVSHSILLSMWQRLIYTWIPPIEAVTPNPKGEIYCKDQYITEFHWIWQTCIGLKLQSIYMMRLGHQCYQETLSISLFLHYLTHPNPLSLY